MFVFIQNELPRIASTESINCVSNYGTETRLNPLGCPFKAFQRAPHPNENVCAGQDPFNFKLFFFSFLLMKQFTQIKKNSI